MLLAVWPDFDESISACSIDEQPLPAGAMALPVPSSPELQREPSSADQISVKIPVGSPSTAFVRQPIVPAPDEMESTPVAPSLTPQWDHGWPIPSTISKNPDEARACIHLPEFDVLTLEKARVISGRFPFAEAEYRAARGKEPVAEEVEIAHFEKVFRIAAEMAS